MRNIKSRGITFTVDRKRSPGRWLVTVFTPNTASQWHFDKVADGYEISLARDFWPEQVAFTVATLREGERTLLDGLARKIQSTRRRELLA